MKIFNLFYKDKSTIVANATGAKSARELIDKSRFKGVNTSRTFAFERSIADWKRAIDDALSEPYYNRYDLYELYKRITRDAQLRAQMRTRKAGTLSEKFIIKAGTKDITETLETEWFRMIIKKILDTTFYGLSAIEVYKDKQGSIKVTELAPEHFSPERNLLVPNPEMVAEGFPLIEPITDYLLLFEAEKENKLGLLADATPYALYKSFSLTDWARHSERFGTPFVVLKTPITDQRELSKYANMLANFGNNGYTILDETDNLEFLAQGNAGKPFEIYSEMIKFCDEQISKVIVGQTSTADTKAFVGSAEVQERILDWHIEEDMLMVKNEMNSKVLPMLAKLGASPAGATFEWEFFEQKKAKPTAPQPPKGELKLGNADFYTACC